MPGLMEADQVGKRQDLSDYIVNIERTETPLFTVLPKDTVRRSTFETLVDDYGDTNDIRGVGTSEDAKNFKNQAENRGIIDNQVMKMWENPAVDDFAENVNEVEALPRGEYVEGVRKALVRLKFRAEKRILSRVEASRQEDGRVFGTCSIGGFLKSTAPVGTQVVPERFRLPSGQIWTGALSTLTEDSVRGVLKEIFESTNGKGKFTAPVGSNLKEAISLMSIYRPDKASNTVVRHINSQNNGTLDMTVDIITGDFGTVELMPSTRMRYFDQGASVGEPSATTEAQRRGSGYVLDLSMWGLAFKRAPGHKPLADEGGGPRGIVDMIFGLRCKNPRGNGAFYAAS